MFENKELRKISGVMIEENTGGRKTLHEEKLLNL
jgi:hypothetical protein